MYRAASLSSPLFDMPEFPTLRRVKPLPKRRRMTADSTEAGTLPSASAATTFVNGRQSGTIQPDPGGPGIGDGEDAGGGAGNAAAHALFLASLEGLQLPGPDATAEELLAHAETLSSRMAMHGYYNYGPVPPMLPIPSVGDADGGDGVGDTSNVALGPVPLPAMSPPSPPLSYLDAMTSLGAGQYSDGVGLGIGVGNYGGPGIPSFGSAYPAYGLGEVEREDEECGEGGEYIDHLQQPGNTKKRKVPANAAGRGHEPGSPHSLSAGDHDTDEVGGGEDGGVTVRRSHIVDDVYQPHESYHQHSGLTVPDTGVFPTTQGLSNIHRVGRRGRVSAATLAGLQHKEMLKARKRQLAAVLGALSLGDTLALDQALSANYPSFGEDANGINGGKKEPKMRLSRRRNVRMARIARRLGRHPDQLPFPVANFEFMWPSATADRLIATKEEVAMLRNRFEAELARQAKKAARAAANQSGNSLSGISSKNRSSKRAGERTQQRRRKGGDQVAEFLDQHHPSPTATGTTKSTASTTSTAVGPVIASKGGKRKKKKRSALANASNPHHLRNYVPSRLPSNGGHGAGNGNVQNLVWPLPLRFLSAEISVKRSGTKKVSAHSGTAGAVGEGLPQLTNPADEWICAFCEYELFYGDEQEYRRAIRNRKKILKRRRKARERAVAAASGSVKPTGRDEDQQEGLEEAQEPAIESVPASSKSIKSKVDPTHRDRGGGGGEQSAYG